MKLHYLFFLLIMGFSQYLCSAQIYKSSDPFIHNYQGHYLYEGDIKGNYKGDLAVILDDGSTWKVHPNYNELLDDWEIGDLVHVEERFFCLLKRDHKFMLFNHQKNQRLSVMLINTPLVVRVAELPFPTSRTAQPWPWPEYIYGDYRQNIILSDGSRWEIHTGNEETAFAKNTPAYVGYREEGTGSEVHRFFFVIGGTGKEATWEFAISGHYVYLPWKP